MERALSSEQRRSDFLPRDDALSFDKPTSACLLGTALLVAMRDAVQGTLEDANKQAFLAEVRCSAKCITCLDVGEQYQGSLLVFCLAVHDKGSLVAGSAQTMTT